MSNKKQTAVEWLLEKCPRIETIASLELIDQAKAMYEEQMGLCFLAGDDSELQDVTFEQYYRETYEL